MSTPSDYYNAPSVASVKSKNRRYIGPRVQKVALTANTPLIINNPKTADNIYSNRSTVWIARPLGELASTASVHIGVIPQVFGPSYSAAAKLDYTEANSTVSQANFNDIYIGFSLNAGATVSPSLDISADVPLVLMATDNCNVLVWEFI